MDLPDDEKALIEARVRAEREAQKKVEAEEQQAKTKEQVQGCLGCLAVMIVLAIGFALFGPAGDGTDPMFAGQQGRVHTGDEGAIWLSTEKEGISLYYDALSANDEVMKGNVQIAFDMKLLPHGTRLLCLQREGVIAQRARVRVLSGTFEGREGWIDGEFTARDHDAASGE